MARTVYFGCSCKSITKAKEGEQTCISLPYAQLFSALRYTKPDFHFTTSSFKTWNQEENQLTKFRDYDLA